MKLLRNGWIVVALFLLGLMASRAEAATGNSASPVTLRGTTAATAPDEDDGSTIVLRGSTPPPSPPALYTCAPGYADVTGTGCIMPNDGNYADQSDYDWAWWPYDFGSNRRRAFHPRRRAFAGFAHHVVHNGRMGRR